jgi:Retrotransposon gag protein
VLQQLVACLQTDASSREPLMAEVGVITKAVVKNLPAPVVEVPPAQASTPAVSAHPPKAADPKIYGGDQKKADPFLCSLKLNIAIQPKSFPDDQTKILYALSYMQGGSAGDWASKYTHAILDGDSPFPDWETFCNCFEAAFGEADQAAHAHQHLHYLKMTQGMTAEEYTMAFEAISGKTGFNDEALMDAYEHGLLHNLVEKIHLDTLPLSLQEWKDKATCIDKLWQCFNEQHSFSPTNPHQDNHPGTN